MVCVTAYLCIIDVNALLFLRRLLASDLSLMGVHREKMSFSVEHPSVQVNLVLVCEEEVEVLKGLSKKEGFHHVLTGALIKIISVLGVP